MKLTIPGKPIAKKRPRFVRRGKFVSTYNDQKEVEETIKYYLELQAIGRKIKGPVFVHSIFYMPRPKSHYGTGRNANTLKASAPKYHTVKPDIDNLEKMVYDCLNRVIWNDDACIVKSYSVKIYSNNPRTVITIKEV